MVIAKAAGFMISVDDLNKAAGYQELSEEELEGVAGGGGGGQCWIREGFEGGFSF